MATLTQTYGSYSALTVTNLNLLSSSSTAIWQSDLINNLTTKAADYKIMVKLPTFNSAPANDKSMYVFVNLFTSTDAGSTWLSEDIGTTTLPTGTQGTATINSSSTLRLLGVLNYATANQTCQKEFNLSNAVGNYMPEAFSILIENYSGATLQSDCIVAIQSLTNTIA